MVAEIDPNSKYGQRTRDILLSDESESINEFTDQDSPTELELSLYEVVQDIVIEAVSQTDLVLMDGLLRELSFGSPDANSPSYLGVTLDHVEDLQIPDWRSLKSTAPPVLKDRTEHMIRSFLCLNNNRWRPVNRPARAGDRVHYRFRLIEAGGRLTLKKTSKDDYLLLNSDPEIYSDLDRQFCHHLLGARSGDKLTLELQKNELWSSLDNLPFKIELKVDEIREETNSARDEQAEAALKKLPRELSGWPLVDYEHRLRLEHGHRLLEQLIAGMTCLLPKEGLACREENIIQTANNGLVNDDLSLDQTLDHYRSLCYAPALAELEIKRRLVVTKILTEAKINCKDILGQKRFDPLVFFFKTESNEDRARLANRAVEKLLEVALKK